MNLSMKILLIDTCGDMGSVALAETGEDAPKIVSTTLPGRSTSERLVATLRELAGTADFALTELDTVVVVNGPGSFTGVRVGVSAAKGLCEALGLPVVAISRLAVLTEGCGLGRVVAALDAGRGEFYCGVYQDGSCLHEALVTRMILEEQVEGARLVTCEPLVAVALAELAPEVLDAPTAEAALPIALRRIAASEFDDVGALDANYLRRTDAEIFVNQQRGRTPA